MRVASVPLYAQAGHPFLAQFRFAEPTDLTGCEAALVLPGREVAAVVDPATATLRFEIDDTDALASAAYILRLVSSDGVTFTPAHGFLTVTPLLSRLN